MNDVLAQPSFPVMEPDAKAMLLNTPAWSQFFYQNFLLPAMTPGNNGAATASANNFGVNPADWLISPLVTNGATAAAAAAAASPTDYFGNAWAQAQAQFTEKLAAAINVNATAFKPTADGLATISPTATPMAAPAAHNAAPTAGASSFFPQPYYLTSIPTSLLTSISTSATGPASGSLSSAVSASSSSSMNISPSVEAIDRDLRSPSPASSSRLHSPATSPKLAGKRRAESLDSDVDFLGYAGSEHDDDMAAGEHDAEVPEGVERDGMIWGMKVENYRALSARERKRVRNRISARTFRAKRKEHLSSLEHTLNSKDLQIKHASDEASRLRREVAELRRRLAKYEQV